MSGNFRRIVSLLLASVLCIGLGVTAMADEEEEYFYPSHSEAYPSDYEWGYGYDDHPTQDDFNATIDISIDNSREYQKDDIVNIYTDLTYGLPMEAVYYTISPASYASYFRQVGNSFVVLKQDTAPVRITVTAVYEIGSLHLSDSDYFVLAAEQKVDPLSVRIAPASGGSSFAITVGDTINVSAEVSGGAYGSSYSFSWACSSGLELVSSVDGYYGAATFRAVRPDENAYISVTAISGTQSAEARISGSVAGVSTPFWMSVSESSVNMDAGTTGYISVSGEGGSRPYRFTWESSDNSIVRVAAGRDDSVCTVVAVGAGKATITVRGYDSEGKGDIAYCTVNVTGGKANIVYNPEATVSSGEMIYTSPIISAILSEYKRQTGSDLPTTSKMVVSTPSGVNGAFYYPDGSIIAKESSAYALMTGAYFRGAAMGTFYTYYSIEDRDGNSISGNIGIKVTASKIKINSVVISASNLEMPTWSTRNLSISVLPSNATYEVVWTSANTNVVKVNGSGNNITLSSQGLYGISVVSARVKDLSNNQYVTVTCTVSVQNKSAVVYNPELTLTYGSDYNGTGMSDSVARQFLSSFGISLGYDAVVRFGSVGNTKGTLFLYNGAKISQNVNYTFRDLQLMSFTPNDVGTFSIPYSVTYSGYTLSGTMYVYINGSKLSVTPSTTSVTLDPYSSQYVYLSISPANAYYTVDWSSDNAQVATVTERTTYYTTINSKGIAGTATIRAAVKDGNGITTVKNIKVTVRNSGASDYNPSTTTYIGSTTAGTTIYDSIRSQFRTVYGAALPDTATITFGSSDSSIAARYLSDGRQVSPNVKYSMGEYKAMYTRPSSAGTWSTPYTVANGEQTLSGKIQVIIGPANASAAITLKNSDPYSFTSAAAESTGAELVKAGIEDALGKSGLTAATVRFETINAGSGTLYADSNRSVLTDKTNVTVDKIRDLYFVPGTAGTFTSIFHVYDARGGELAAGYLYIIVPASTEGVTVVATTQNVTVDGKKVDAEIYNINGENYFKLRDVAQMLSGTNSQFNVGFNDETRTITVTTSKAYVSVGSELVKGEDKSSTCVPSSMPIFVNGASVSPTAYNIGGNNFLRLRDLGDMIGFGVGYDDATRTVLITSR